MATDTPDRPSLVEWIALTIDCADPHALGDFYIDGLGAQEKRRTDDSTWLVLDGLPIILRAVEGYRPPTWPSTEVPLQTHFEVMVDDPDEAAAHLTAHGATFAEHQDPDDPHFVVMLDPAGQPFCLIRNSMATRL